MAFWNFLVNEEGWTLQGGMTWIVDEGHPPGCLGGGDATLAIALTPSASDPASMWYRVVSDTDTSLDIGTIIVTLTIDSSPELQAVITVTPEMAGLPYDSGWLKLTGTVGTTSIAALGIETTAGTASGYTVYVDTVYVAEAEPVAAAAQFYQGVNSLSLKSSLPFAGVRPGAMAISPDGQVAVLGSNAAAGQMVVYAANPWGSWINMTPPLPTGTAVSSVKYI